MDFKDQLYSLKYGVLNEVKNKRFHNCTCRMASDSNWQVTAVTETVCSCVLIVLALNNTSYHCIEHTTICSLR